jgi:hypothetical protein
VSVLAPEPTVALVTIPNVPLISVGVWQASTGEHEYTKDDLAAIVAALDDPAIHEPRLRIGHSPPTVTPDESAGGFEEQPAFGRFTNLRLEDGGATIVADAVGVPAWLAEILPSAFPNRSIESYSGYTTAQGRTHSCVLTSVALLGVSMPACQTLEDLQLAFGAEIPEGVEFSFLERVNASQGDHMPERTSASVTYSDVRRSFYDDVANEESGRYWWWLTDLIMSPATAIADADDGTGTLWSVPYKIGKDDTITWSDPVEVRVQYVEVKSGKVAASHADTAPKAERHSFSSAVESRPIDRVRAAKPTEGDTVDGAQLREALDLPADATDEQVTEKLAASKAALAAAEKPDPSPEPDKPEAPVAPELAPTAVPPDVFAQMQEDARLGREAREQQLKMERESLVDAKIERGALTPKSRTAHIAELSKGGEIEKTHRAYLASLTDGLIPVKERGVGDAGEQNNGGVSIDVAMASLGFKRLVTTGKEQ